MTVEVGEEPMMTWVCDLCRREERPEIILPNKHAIIKFSIELYDGKTWCHKFEICLGCYLKIRNPFPIAMIEKSQ